MTKEQEFRKQAEEAKFEAFSFMCKKVAELEAQIEKMKCCGNCKFQEIEDYTGCPICNISNCNFNSKWELKE
jgi:hypothetical protein